MIYTVAHSVYYGADSGATRSFCCRLEKLGQRGRIAAALFRAQKSSCRAKAYRGGIRRSDGSFSTFRDLSYERKSECLKRLCELLAANSTGLAWGWGIDSTCPVAPYVLYLELPVGQISFHNEERFSGPEYPGEWDGAHASEDRILQFCDLQMRQNGAPLAW